MFQNLTQTSNLITASSEIAILFGITLSLGIMLWWLIKPSKNHEVLKNKKNTPATVKRPVLEKKEDDLQLIEGIGPAIEKLLHKHEINTYQDMVKLDVSGLDDILEQGGVRFKKHIPTTWPDQARLASAWKWSELEEYQEILNTKK